jgi:hypothetical protein
MNLEYHDKVLHKDEIIKRHGLILEYHYKEWRVYIDAWVEEIFRTTSFDALYNFLVSYDTGKR